MTGKKPVGEFGDGVDIVQWVRKMTGSNKEDVPKILDPRLLTVPLHEAVHIFHVAMLCVEEQSVERPAMREVVQMLTELPRPSSIEQVEDESSFQATTIAPIESKEHPPPDLLSI